MEVRKMAKKILILLLAILMFKTLILSDFTGAQKASPAKPLPDMFVWTSLATGSTGHSTSVGFGEAIRKITGVPVKIIPDPTDIGGWLPILTGKAYACFRGSASSYASSAGIGKVFGLPEWGPQRVRMIWQTPLIVGIATTKGTGIKTNADLKGKRIPDYRGWGSGRTDLNAVFAGFNIKRDEVIWVPTTGYVDGIKALGEGKVDVAFVAPDAALAKEVDATTKGIVWLEGPKEPEAIKRWLQMAPYLVLFWWDIEGPGGLSPKNPIWSSGERYLVLSHEKLDPELAYLMTKGIWEGYDIYKDMHPVLKRATHKEMLDYTVAIDPYHEGTIRYLKEIKVWTTEHERHQKEKLELEAQRIRAWEEAAEEAKKKGIKLNDPAWFDEEKGFCVEYLRGRGLIPLPEIKYHPYVKR
jgi:TRAP transporter TAXI family solute receptor